jgi:hypothetical protein
MVNFVVDPEPFALPEVIIEDGGPLRREVYIKWGGGSKNHEDCAIAVWSTGMSVEEKHQFMHQISQYIVVEAQQQVQLYALHPHGVGIFRLRTACQRDILISHNPHFIGHREVMFYPHDEAPLNFRRVTLS